MAKIELKYRASPTASNILFVPGGPGLSPISFDPLIKHLSMFNLYCFYPTGTGGEPSIIRHSYDEQLSELVAAMKNFKGKTFICGHSFGGIISADLSLRNTQIGGLICVATPFKAETFAEVWSNFRKHKPEVTALDKEFESGPTDDLYSRWFAAHANAYFSMKNINQGRRMLLEDSMCVANYLGARSESSKKEFLLRKLNETNIPKLFLAGVEDLLMPVDVLGKDADAGGFDLKVIRDAGHFVHFDNPSETAVAIQEFIKEVL